MAFLLQTTDDIEDAVNGLTEAEMEVPDEEFKECPAYRDTGASDPTMRAASIPAGLFLR